MAFEVVASSFQQKTRDKSVFRRIAEVGVIGGGVLLYFNLVGLMNQFMERWIIENTLTLAHSVFIGVALGTGLLMAHRSVSFGKTAKVVNGVLAGLIAGAFLAALVLILDNFDVRFMFVALSPKLKVFLALGQDAEVAALIYLAAGAIASGLGALLYVLPKIARQPILIGLASAFFAGLFAELIQLAMQFETVEAIREYFFTWEGQTLEGAITVFVIAIVVMVFWNFRGQQVMSGYRAMPSAGQKSIKYSLWFIALVLFLLFPMAAGSFFGQVLMLVGLYVLMGMGLNIEIGLAGLLDMGFVAFFLV